MRLLGVLGFNWKIFIIQAINFLVLFLLLKKIFFEPFIIALKKEKKNIEDVEMRAKQIEKEKKKWEEEKKREIIEAKEKIEGLITQAEKIAKKRREEIEKEEFEEEKELLEKIRKQSNDILEEYKKNLEKNYKARVINSLLALFEKELSQEAKKRIEDSLWFNFIQKLENIDLEIEELKKEIALLKKERKSSKKYLLSIIIYSVSPLNSFRRSIIKKIFNEKLGKGNFVLKEEIKPDLIAGFRVEFGGFLLEESLKSKIESIFSSSSF